MTMTKTSIWPVILLASCPLLAIAQQDSLRSNPSLPADVLGPQLIMWTQMQKPHDYVVYLFGLMDRAKGGPPKKTTMDMHAGEGETSTTMVNFPDLVKLDQAKTQSGEDQHRQHLPDTLYTGIWWYARFPNHYSGDGSAATKELGEFEMKAWEDKIVEAIKAVKADQDTLKIQNEFYQKISHPLDTRP